MRTPLLQLDAAYEGLLDRMLSAAGRYGNFASTHEALGVASEEWDELRHAIHMNDLPSVKRECLDLAAVLIRLHDAMDDPEVQARSVK